MKAGAMKNTQSSPETRLVRPARVRGFTLVEVLIATALLGFALIVMFGLHNQSVRSNVMARKVTDCTYLSQSKMEELLATEWTSTAGRSTGQLADGTAGVSTAYDSLYQPAGGSDPTTVNAIWETKGSESSGQPNATYYVTWEVEDNSDNGEWVQVWVRCGWDNRQFIGEGASSVRHALTISSYKFVDDGVATAGGSGSSGSGGGSSSGGGTSGGGSSGGGGSTGGDDTGSTGDDTGGPPLEDDTGEVTGGDDTGFPLGDDTGRPLELE